MKEPAPQENPRTRRVLVVEDNWGLRMVLSEALRDAGFVVVEAAHAVEALAFLTAGQAVDLIFSDIQMPGGVSGVELAARVRRDYPGIPVILTTAGPPPLNLTDAVSFIAKPYSVHVAVAAVWGALNHTPGDD